jgi:hypothetical protein
MTTNDQKLPKITKNKQKIPKITKLTLLPNTPIDPKNKYIYILKFLLCATLGSIL